MSDPTLGFNVDPSGLKTAQSELKNTTEAAQQTEQQAQKTSEALNKMGGSAGSASGIKQTAQSVDDLAKSLVQASAEANKHLNVLQAMETIVAKTGADYTQANAALNSAIAAHKSAGAAATEHAAGLDAVAAAAGGAIPPIEAGGQAAEAFGASLGGLGLAAGIVAGSIGIAAAGLGVFAVQLAKVSDETERQKFKWEAITGSVKAGDAAFQSIRDTAHGLNADFDSFSGAIDKALQGTDKLASGWPVISVGMNKTAADADKLKIAFGELQHAMEDTGQTGKQENAVIDALGTSFGKTGTLTAQAFQTIRDQSPVAARLIASAFNVNDINAFQAALEQQPKAWNDVTSALERAGPAMRASLDPQAIHTYEQATRQVSNAWSGFLETLANTGVFGIVAGFVNTLAAAIRVLNDEIKNVPANLAKTAGSGQEAGLKPFDFAAPGGGQVGAAQDASAPYAFDNSGTLAAAGSMAGFATGGSFKVGGNGGTDSQLIQFMATPGEQVTISPPGQSAGGGQTLGSLLPDNGGATGGPDLLAAHISSDLQDQTASLKDKLDQINTKETAAIATATTQIVAAIKAAGVGGGTVTATSAGNTVASAASAGTANTSASSSSGGGGGISGWKSDPGNRSDTGPAQTFSINGKQVSADQFYAAQMMGQGTSIKGFQSPYASDAIGVPYGAQGIDKSGRLDLAGFDNPLTPLLEQQRSQTIQQGYGYWPTGPMGQPTPVGPLGTAAAYMNQNYGGFTTIDNNAGAALAGFGGDGAAGAANGTIKDVTASQDKSATTISSTVKTGTDTAKVIADKTYQYLDDVQIASQDGATAAQDVKTSTDDGNQQAQAAAQQAASLAQVGNTATADVGSSVDAASGEISQGVTASGDSIVSAVDSLGSTISSALSTATSNAGGISGGGQTSSGSSSGGSSSGGPVGNVVNGVDTGGTTLSAGQGVSVGGAGMADGGLVSGPGTSASDSIPAQLSDGEFVHKAAAVEHYGVDFMHAINNKRLKKFADGGQVTLGSALGASGNPGASADIITAHIHEIIKEQTASLKDSITDARIAIVSSINTGEANISSAVKTLQGTLSTSLSAIQSAAASRAAATTTAVAGGGSSSLGNPTSAVVTNPLTGKVDPRYYHPYTEIAGKGYYSPLAEPLIQYGLGGTGNIAMADGGMISGAGTSTSDSVPAMLSNGEFVHSAAAVSHYGSDFMHAINSRQLRKFSDGGVVLASGSQAQVSAKADSQRYDQGAKTVTIYVQQGVQADQFIRSRAEIQRAMR